jgi:hypothetical protein
MQDRSSPAVGDQRTCILGSEHLLDPSAHLFVGQEFAAVELVQPLLYLLPEPDIMVHVVFDELLDIFSRAAVVLFGASSSGFKWTSMFVSMATIARSVNPIQSLARAEKWRALCFAATVISSPFFSIRTNRPRCP